MIGRPDTRYVVLLALYSEYTRDDGDFRRIGAEALEMKGNIFGWALYRLQTEGLIEGCKFQPPNPQSANQLIGVLRDGLRVVRGTVLLAT